MDAGSLPIKGVTITYQIYSENFVRLDCDDCSGSVLTNEGGGFTIDFNLDHPFLHGVGESDDIPVVLTFHKTTGSGDNGVDHLFLCNELLEVCNEDGGHTIFLNHLAFKTPLRVHDDTGVPFRGVVSIADTDLLCKVANAEVCLVEHIEMTGTQTPLVCGSTNGRGEYELPAVLGIRVDDIEIKYNEHTFEATEDSRFEAGTIIAEGGFYSGMDFVDVTKTELTVEVAGGLCNRNLGLSDIGIKIVGCPQWDGLTYSQGSFTVQHSNIEMCLLMS